MLLTNIEGAPAVITVSTPTCLGSEELKVVQNKAHTPSLVVALSLDSKQNLLAAPNLCTISEMETSVKG